MTSNQHDPEKHGPASDGPGNAPISPVIWVMVWIPLAVELVIVVGTVIFQGWRGAVGGQGWRWLGLP